MSLALYLSRVRSNEMLGVTSAAAEERTGLCFKQSYKHWVHVFELVRDIQADHALVFELGAKVLPKPVPMCSLHDEYYVGPLNKLGRNGILGVSVGACRCHFESRAAAKDLLGRWAPKLIL
jgi:hypothetical protein